MFSGRASAVRPSVRCLSVNTYFACRDICVQFISHHAAEQSSWPWRHHR